MSALERALAESPAVPLAGNAPLRLDPSAQVWFVETGTAEVFAVPEEGEGPRIHLCSVAAGQLLCGLRGATSLGLLAVGHSGTVLRRLPADRFQELAHDPGAAAELATRLDGWLAGLLAALSPAAGPKIFAELRPGAETHLAEAGKAARAQAGVAWVRHLEGSSRLMGELELALGEALFPMPEGLWLVSAGEARIAALGTLDLLAGEALWPGLARFHEICLHYVALQGERGERQDRERLARRLDLDRSRLRGAYARLASILLPMDGAGTTLQTGSGADPLLAACVLVGQAQGIPLRTRADAPAGGKLEDRLAQICAASRVRSRRVILRDDWWRRDNGALVGFLTLDPEQQTKRPVALLPASSRAYEMIDPEAGTRVRVDAAVAESLSGDAHMFYPPFPERPLTRGDLLRATFAGRREDLLSILLMGACGGLLGMLVPILTGELFGTIIPGAYRGQLLQITLALVVSALSGAVFQLTRSIAVLRIGGRADSQVQSAVWDRLLALPVTFFRQFTVGDLANRSLGINSIREMLTGNALTLLLGAVFSVFSFALLFYYSWRLALIATALVILLTGVTAGLVYLQIRQQRELLRLQGKIASLLFGLINGIAKLRVAGAEARAYARWAERFAEQRRRTLAAQRVANVQTAFNAVYGVLTSLVIFAVVGFASTETMPTGEFLAFSAAFGQFLAAALSLVGAFSSVLAMVPVYERLSPILEAVPEVDESKAEPGDLAGEIEFSHVSFRYQGDGPLILDDVSFRAGPGEFIALVGPSGAGKSTCLRLILGFEKATSGSIYFDGQDLAGLAVQSVRRQTGVVLQSGRPMAGSIFSNITGSSNLGIDEAWAAARAAGLEEDIKAMPMGMHTVISEGAETFSGGQKQRILIARAVVNRPRIILFDEATSALDNRTQEIVSRSLERLKATRIVIAHRLSTIQNADRIYVVDGGRVVEAGSYQDLLQRGGPFARLAERQIA
ncbi:MAG TPA: NHLP bacteriocin export ABC transporter permease/ATPase subunit [Thermoanaerobaculia bacterium]|jgi:NHLM bacteriocin system ABC transporter ATP-binding protein|nr:NHLP bacteriocin export ABC transporter permease/ATPase subunit [Thermoanaerobaculia bacterium]